MRRRNLVLLFTLLYSGSAIAETNLVDRFVFARSEKDHIPAASNSSDSEFLRRIYLDLTGRLPEAAVARKFLADKDPAKRDKVVDSLIPSLPTEGKRSVSQSPFLDRWTYFFCDLFKNGEVLEEGINTFYDFIYKSLTLNIPYDDFVRTMLTASTISTWTDGPANFLARSHVFEGDGFSVNHEDTADEIAINTTRLFLGVNLECVSCHDGKGHLEKINLWLAERKRSDLWRQANFFGKTRIAPVYGRSPQFLVRDTEPGYNLKTPSSLRPTRNDRADITPTFLLTGATVPPTESPREAYGRMVTTNPQFARATVNLFWAELMGEGIVDPPLDFDLLRQDPLHPPPAPWTLQPSNPQLLNALADAFREHRYDLRWLLRTIVTSRAYQLSSKAPAGWKDTYQSYFTRRIVRRMSAEQLWDAIGQVTAVMPPMKVSFSDKKAIYVMQTHSPQDIDKSSQPLYRALQSFGQCDRYQADASLRPSMVQTAVLMNGSLLRERVAVQPGSRLESLLSADAAKTNQQIVDELFFAALSRPPDARELATGVEALQQYRSQGAEDLLWALLNRLEFVFY